jgi:acyl carrier protein
MSTQERLRNFIVTDLGWRGAELTDDYPLIENHVIDSLGLFQIVSFLESEYGVTIDDGEITPDKFATLKVIAELVDNSRSAESVSRQGTAPAAS